MTSRLLYIICALIIVMLMALPAVRQAITLALESRFQYLLIW